MLDTTITLFLIINITMDNSKIIKAYLKKAKKYLILSKISLIPVIVFIVIASIFSIKGLPLSNINIGIRIFFLISFLFTAIISTYIKYFIRICPICGAQFSFNFTTWIDFHIIPKSCPKCKTELDPDNNLGIWNI